VFLIPKRSDLMARKENEKIRMKNTHSRGGISCNWGITVQKESHLKEAICEKCDKVFKTNKDDYICPDCQNKS
jgi:Zn finger protein HypA/HybF involved in hydrogenase expression